MTSIFGKNSIMMSRILLIFPSLLLAVHALGEFSILKSPSSLDFKGNEKLETDSVGDVLAASLGHSVLHNSYWSGLYVRDPFNVAKGVVAVVIEGVENVHTSTKSKSFTLVGDSIQDTFNMLSSNLEEQNSPVVDIDLNQGTDALLTYSDILGQITVPSNVKTTGTLKPDLHTEDKLFLQQIAVLKSLADKFTTLEKLPTLFTIRVSMSPIAFAHGEKSSAMTDALKLISEAVETLSEAASKAYENNLLSVVVTFKDNYSRNKRQAEQKDKDLNLAKKYSENYPVIFNIILWFGVVFAFSLLAISYSIATMDPGRDSIIYRMTSTRMKKEN